MSSTTTTAQMVFDINTHIEMAKRVLPMINDLKVTVAHPEDLPARIPSMIGDFGLAWEHTYEDHFRRYLRKAEREPNNPALPPLTRVEWERDAFVTEWLIYRPGANVMWHSYRLAAYARINPPADAPWAAAVAPWREHLPGARHEFLLEAMSPDYPYADEDSPRHYLTPVNFAAQLVMPDNAAMRQLMGATVRDIVDGKLNPDTDAVDSQWVPRFNASMLRRSPPSFGDGGDGLAQLIRMFGMSFPRDAGDSPDDDEDTSADPTLN